MASAAAAAAGIAPASTLSGRKRQRRPGGDGGKLVALAQQVATTDDVATSAAIDALYIPAILATLVASTTPRPRLADTLISTAAAPTATTQITPPDAEARARAARRQRQIDMGTNTVGYMRYVAAGGRGGGGAPPDPPPPPAQRALDAHMSTWRRALHRYDLPGGEGGGGGSAVVVATDGRLAARRLECDVATRREMLALMWGDASPVARL